MGRVNPGDLVVDSASFPVEVGVSVSSAVSETDFVGVAVLPVDRVVVVFESLLLEAVPVGDGNTKTVVGMITVVVLSSSSEDVPEPNPIPPRTSDIVSLFVEDEATDESDELLEREAELVIVVLVNTLLTCFGK